MKNFNVERQFLNCVYLFKNLLRAENEDDKKEVLKAIDIYLCYCEDNVKEIENKLWG